MFSFFKNHFIIYVLIFFILCSCKLQEPLKTHGIIFLENRANKLTVNKSNKNDVINIFGQPQIKESDKIETWIYLERILTKGKYHKLGKHVLKQNNILILDFNKYGILQNKKLLDKNDINQIKFSKRKTDNELSQKSFVTSFLESVRQKMYMNRK
jgi:outer membrane protein assembly factor BamE (lipoprotein component of BamABCDE complex)